MSTRRTLFWQIDALAAGALLAATAGAYFLIVEPDNEARARERERLAALGPREELREQMSMALRRARDRLEGLRAELERSPLRLEPVSRLNQRLARITALATEQGLGLDQVAPGNQSSGADAVVVEMRLVGRGGFEEARAFLARLHAEFADMAVSEFHLGGTPAQPDSGTFLLNLAWYAASEPPAGESQASIPLP